MKNGGLSHYVTAAMLLYMLAKYNFRIVNIFSSHTTRNNQEVVAETQSFIFRRSSRCGRRRPCLKTLPFSDFDDNVNLSNGKCINLFSYFNCAHFC